MKPKVKRMIERFRWEHPDSPESKYMRVLFNRPAVDEWLADWCYCLATRLRNRRLRNTRRANRQAKGI